MSEPEPSPPGLALPLAPSAVVFPLKPPGPLNRPIMAAGAFLVTLAGAELIGLPLLFFWGRSHLVLSLSLGAAAGLAVALGPLRRRVRPPSQVPPIRIEATGLRLPRNIRSPKEEWVPFEAVTRLEAHRRRRVEWLRIHSTRRIFLFPRSSFTDAGDFQRFAAAAREAVNAHNPRLLENIDHQRELAVSLGRVRPIATLVLMALIAVAFGATELMGGATPPVLVRLGANAPVLDHQGQWFRLVTANFLHGSWLHIYLNALALLSLGVLLERLFGTARFLVVFLLSALGGTAASMLNATHPLSVGISTALFGLLGAWAFAAWRFRSSLPVGFHRTRRWWLFQLGINAALSAIPIVDWAAHLGGFVAGIAATALVFSGAKVFRDPPRAATWVAASALVAVFVYGLALGVRHAVGSWDWADEAARSAFDLPRATPSLINSMAWQMALDPKTEPAILRRAAEAMDRVTSQRPSDFNFRDTSATLRHRLGEEWSAVFQECEALRLERASNPNCGDCKERRVFQAQLTRFMAARETADLGHAKDSMATGVALQAERVDADWLPDGVLVHPPSAGPTGLHAYALLQDGRRKLLLEIEGQVALPGTKVDALSLPITWPDSSISAPPRFACVDWGDATQDTLTATPARLDTSVARWP